MRTAPGGGELSWGIRGAPAGTAGPGPGVRDPSTPPGPRPGRPFQFPEIVSAPLPNGLRVAVAPMGRFPLVTVAVVLLDGGEGEVEGGEAGLAVLAGRALEGGSARRSGQELARALEGLGASLALHTGWDAVTVSATALAPRLPAMLALLAEVVMEPAFPEPEVERLRNQQRAALRQRRMEPGTLADDMACRVIYAPGTPYHRPLIGTASSLEGADSARVRAFAGRRYGPRRTVVVVAGDVGPEEAIRQVEGAFGTWENRGGDAAGGGIPVARGTGGGRIWLVHRPEAVQSEIRIGQMGAPRNHPRHLDLEVFNTVLGGIFTSRLMLNLREKQGFTYGARSRFSFRRKAGPFLVSTAVTTDVTAPAVREALGEIRGLWQEGPTPGEVGQARDFLTGVFPLRLETTAQLAARVSELFVYDLPDDFFRTYRDRLAEVSPRGVQEAAGAVLNPEEMAVVVVGSAPEVRGPLEDLGWGPVEVLEPPDA